MFMSPPLVRAAPLSNCPFKLPKRRRIPTSPFALALPVIHGGLVSSSAAIKAPLPHSPLSPELILLAALGKHPANCSEAVAPERETPFLNPITPKHAAAAPPRRRAASLGADDEEEELNFQVIPEPSASWVQRESHVLTAVMKVMMMRVVLGGGATTQPGSELQGGSCLLWLPRQRFGVLGFRIFQVHLSECE